MAGAGRIGRPAGAGSPRTSCHVRRMPPFSGGNFQRHCKSDGDEDIGHSDLRNLSPKGGRKVEDNRTKSRFGNREGKNFQVELAHGVAGNGGFGGGSRCLCRPAATFYCPSAQTVHGADRAGTRLGRDSAANLCQLPKSRQSILGEIGRTPDPGREPEFFTRPGLYRLDFPACERVVLKTSGACVRCFGRKLSYLTWLNHRRLAI
jgi:hypothetical protein